MSASADGGADALWTFATAFYARAGIEPALLHLQDERDLDVPVLITLLYAGRQGLVLSGEELDAMLALAANWQTKAIAPLRIARRALKPPEGTVTDLAQEALRRRIKEAELGAEHLLLTRLEALLPPQQSPEPGKAGRLNLIAYLKAVGLPPDLAEFELLIEESLKAR